MARTPNAKRQAAAQREREASKRAAAAEQQFELRRCAYDDIPSARDYLLELWDEWDGNLRGKANLPDVAVSKSAETKRKREGRSIPGAANQVVLFGWSRNPVPQPGPKPLGRPRGTKRSA